MIKKSWIIPIVTNIVFGAILAFLFGLLLNSMRIERFSIIEGSWVSITFEIWFYVYATMIICFLGYIVINMLLYQKCYKKTRSNSNYSDYLKITLPITILSTVFLCVPYILLKLL